MTEIVETAPSRGESFSAGSISRALVPLPAYAVQDGVLVITNPDKFRADPDTAYRFFETVARTGLDIEASALEFFRTELRYDLAPASRAQQRSCLEAALFVSDPPSRALNLMREAGIIARDFGELQALVGTRQDPIWHPEGDVWVHTLMVVDEARKRLDDPRFVLSREEKLQVMLGALCHDLGKPFTTFVKDGRIRSPGHEAKGEVPARALLGRLGYRGMTVEGAIVCVTDHMKPTAHFRELTRGKITRPQYEKIMLRYADSIEPISWRVMLAVTEADFMGRGYLDGRPERYDAGIAFQALMERPKESTIPPLLRGDDLIGMGFSRGPILTEIQRTVAECRARGEIDSHDSARLFVEREFGHRR